MSHFRLPICHYLRGDMVNQQIGDVVAWVRGSYSGVKISNLRYDFEEADQQIREGKVDAVLLAPSSLRTPISLKGPNTTGPSNEPRPETYYTRTAVGYNDYPTTTTNTDTSTLIIFVFFYIIK
ncbi:hypothetical protein TcBrA4_0061000 [Trypanosoma cruzi]|nr:hypothetical protein TcBrA4_0061000 [Trypanosoma cruzi]